MLQLGDLAYFIDYFVLKYSLDMVILQHKIFYSLTTCILLKDVTLLFYRLHFTIF